MLNICSTLTHFQLVPNLTYTITHHIMKTTHRILLLNIFLTLTVVVIGGTSTPKETADAADLSGLNQDGEGDEPIADDEPNPEDEDQPEDDYGDEDDEFLKLNLPDSYRIFFEFGDREEDLDRENQEDEEDQDEDDGYEDDFHLPESYKVFFEGGEEQQGED